uniref:myb-like protein X n=1 Tax=Scatophagus argus TaxID=75038 RepID=UPI001ED84490|nr:myb-like protein X [Scatophagus argus]
MDNRKELTFPSTLATPPPLPPKSYQRSPISAKTLCQGSQLKASKTEKKPLNSLGCHATPVLGGVKGTNQSLGHVPVEEHGMLNSSIVGILPKLEPNSQTQYSPRPPLKSAIKTPRSNNSEEGIHGSKQEAEWKELKEKLMDKKNIQEQDLTERNEKMEENEETSQTENHLDLSKPPQQMLVSFTDKKNGGEKGQDREKEDQDPGNIGLTTSTMTETSSLPGMDITTDEESDLAPTNRNCTSTASSKPEPTILPHPPPKPPRKYPPKLNIKTPQSIDSMKAGTEEEKEMGKQNDEQWIDKDLMNKEKDENEGEVKDREKLNGDNESTTSIMTEMPFQPGEITMNIPKSAVNQVVEWPAEGRRFCLMPPCRNRAMPVITTENDAVNYESQNPRKEHQNKTNGQLGPLSQEVLAQVNHSETDSNMETLKWTESTEIQMSGLQGSVGMSELSSGHQGETDVMGVKLDPCQLGLKRSEGTQEIAEALLDGQLKHTNQKTNAREKVKQLAKKVMSKLKDGREEKRRTKTVEMDMAGVRENDIDVTKDVRRHWEEGGINDEEKSEDLGDDTVHPSAVTERENHADLKEEGIKRRNATSESPFSSFKVYSSVNLMEELLSGDEWSQFLYRDMSSGHDPPSCQSHSGDTGQLSENFQFNSSTELTPDVFDGTPAVLEEPIYEPISLSNIVTEESQTHGKQEMDRVPVIPKILLDEETNQMSPRTKDIYDTVEITQPVEPANAYMNIFDIKSQGVLDNEVKKYLIKLSKKRKHRAARKRCCFRRHVETSSQSSSSTSSQQVFPASIFYNIPASGGEEQLLTVKSGGSSPRSLAKIKMALKDKTMLRAARPKEDRGK